MMAMMARSRRPLTSASTLTPPPCFLGIFTSRVGKLFRKKGHKTPARQHQLTMARLLGTSDDRLEGRGGDVLGLFIDA